MVLLLVVVHDFNVIGVALTPIKTDSPLIIDPDRILSATIAQKLLQSISRDPSNLIESRSRVQSDKFLQCSALHVGRKASAGPTGEEFRRLLRSKAFDHGAV
jgi:hypothetical protein